VSNIASINAPHLIEISGFEKCDDAAHMFEWLGRGRDFRQFVARDVEEELYRQTPGAQLLSMSCDDKPELVTKVKPQGTGSTAVVTDLRATFLLTVRVAAADGAVWRLQIRHGYEASNIHFRDARQLRLNFTIMAHHREI